MYMSTKTSINASLRVIGITGLAGVSVIAPNTLQGLNLLLKNSKTKVPKSQRILAELKRQGLVHITPLDNGFHYSLTPKGAYRLQQALIDGLSVKIPKKWDKKWRMVAFDIPVKFSRQRTAFVHKLQELGFMMVQKSMWVHPAPCFDQVEQLAGHYNVLRYCTLFEVSKVDELTARKLTRRFFSE